MEHKKKAVDASEIAVVLPRNKTSSSVIYVNLRDPFIKGINLFGFVSAALALRFYVTKTGKFLPALFLSKKFSNAYLLAVVTIAVHVSIRRYLQSRPVTSFLKHSVDLSNKIVIVTGGTAGLGKASVIQLLNWGARVIIGCRNMTKGKKMLEEIANQLKDPATSRNAQILPLELEDLSSVAKFANDVLSQGIKIDILLNNAGIMLPRKMEYTSDGFERIFAINYLSHFLLTQLLLDNIKASNGRIVNVASLAHTNFPSNEMFDLDNLTTPGECKYNSVQAYAISKLCNILFTSELQRRLSADPTTSATTYSCHPGVVQTELIREATWYMKPIVFAMSFFMKNATEGAATQLYLCAAPTETLRPGTYYDCCKPGYVLKNASNPEREQMLYDRSMQFIAKFLPDAAETTGSGDTLQ